MILALILLAVLFFTGFFSPKPIPVYFPDGGIVDQR